MTLITKQQTEQLLANGIAALEAGRAGLHFDPKPVVKLFPHTRTAVGCSQRSIPSTPTVPTAFAIADTAFRNWALSVYATSKISTARNAPLSVTLLSAASRRQSRFPHSPSPKRVYSPTAIRLVSQG